MVPWNAAKAKVQLRLGVQRLRTLQEKKFAQAKASRREIALLLEKGRLETSRIKTENIINEDIYVELLELLELYCELLIARFGILDQNTPEPDPGVSEGVCAIIFAATRTEIKELHILRELLMHKYGREYSMAVIENRDGCVTERVVRKLDVSTPSPTLVDAYLGEIAKGYGVAWSPPKPEGAGNAEGGSKQPGPGFPYAVQEAADTDTASDENAKKTPSQSAVLPDALGSPKVDVAAISAEARSAGVRTPKLPELPVEGEAGGVVKASSGNPTKKTDAVEDEFNTLAKRFEMLKKR